MSMELAQPKAASHPPRAASTPVVTIDRGIPIPKRMLLSGRQCSPTSTALKKLKIGESLAFPAKNGEDIRRTQHRASGLVGHFKPKKFCTRRVIEDGKAIIRVWRIV